MNFQICRQLTKLCNLFILIWKLSCMVTLSISQTLPLISQSRRMIREGPVTELMDFSLKDTERSVYLHLFNDHLLLSLQKEWADAQYLIVLPLLALLLSSLPEAVVSDMSEVGKCQGWIFFHEWWRTLRALGKLNRTYHGVRELAK